MSSNRNFRNNEIRFIYTKKSKKKKILRRPLERKDDNKEFIKMIPLRPRANGAIKLDFDNFLDMLFNNKDNKKIKMKKDNFKLDPKINYDELEENVNDLDQFIELAEKLKDSKKKYPINVKKMFNLIEPLKEFKSMIGMNDVKKNIIKQILFCLQDLDKDENMMHTVITGPPGVGKTMLGYTLAKLYYKMGLIESQEGKKYVNPLNGEMVDFKFKIARRSDLIGEYVGHTATKTQSVIDESLGGVLFIDEAYSLGNVEKKDIFSKECIDTLNQNLSEHKGKIIVIIAGYDESLEKCFFSYNEGLRRRFSFKYKIDKYSPDELSLIFKKKVLDSGWIIDLKPEFKKFFIDNYDNFPNFGGDMETLLFSCKIAHSTRIFGKNPDKRKKFNMEDLNNGLEIFLNGRKKKQNNIITNMYI